MRNSPLILTLGFLATCQISACTVHEPDHVSSNGPSLKAAREALDEGEASTALGIAQGVLAYQPNNAAALTQAGDAEVALGDRLTGEADYRHALAISPDDVHARLGQGKLRMRSDVKGAEAIFRAVLASAPRDTAAMIDLGVSLDLQERHAEAQTNYTKALTVDPDSGAARVDLALSLALSGKAAQAEDMLRDVTASSLNSPKARADFALAQVMAGHDKDATLTLRADLSPGETAASLEGMQALRAKP